MVQNINPKSIDGRKQFRICSQFSPFWRFHSPLLFSPSLFIDCYFGGTSKKNWYMIRFPVMRWTPPTAICQAIRYASKIKRHNNFRAQEITLIAWNSWVGVKYHHPGRKKCELNRANFRFFFSEFGKYLVVKSLQLTNRKGNPLH